MRITNKAELDAAILALEQKQVEQKLEMSRQFRQLKESLSPLNLIKQSVSKLTSGPEFGDNLLKTLTGLGVGVLSKRLFLGTSPGMIKKILGSVLELAATKTTISNVDKIKAYGSAIYNNLFKSHKNGAAEERTA